MKKIAAILLLIIAITAFLIINKKRRDVIKRNEIILEERRTIYENRVEQLKINSKLISISKGSCLVFVDREKKKRVAFLVIKKDKDQLQGIIKHFEKDNLNRILMDKGHIPFNPFDFDSKDTISLSIKNIITSKPHNSGTKVLSYSFKSLKASNESSYYLNQVFNECEPLFKDWRKRTVTKSSGKSECYAEFFALNYAFTVLEINRIKGKAEWTDILPFEVNTKEKPQNIENLREKFRLNYICEDLEEELEANMLIESCNKKFRYKIFAFKGSVDIVLDNNNIPNDNQ